MLIKIVSAKAAGGTRVRVAFSDGSHGLYDLAHLIERDGSMVKPLRDPAFFARVFVESGAICWPNGLDLSPAAVHRELSEAGALRQPSPA
ncbi:MAG: DUF2442 domain-containing protein [Alphaproteobacteria bacterium]